jgi:hypothetical protein
MANGQGARDTSPSTDPHRRGARRGGSRVQRQSSFPPPFGSDANHFSTKGQE